MKQDLQNEINTKAQQTQQGAINASREGINDLYTGIGLLSDYMGKRSDAQKSMSGIYKAGSNGLLSLGSDLSNQASKIVDGFVANYRR